MVFNTDAGEVYTWGSGKKGQLGFLNNGQVPTSVRKPTKGTLIISTYMI